MDLFKNTNILTYLFNKFNKYMEIAVKKNTLNLNPICRQSSLGSALSKFVGLNETEKPYYLSLTKKLSKVFKDNFLKPNKDLVKADIEEIVKEYDQRNETTQMDCNSYIVNGDKKTISLLLVFYNLFSTFSMKLPLGSLARHFGHSNSKIKKMLNGVLNEYLGINPPASDQIQYNFISNEGGKCNLKDVNYKRRHQIYNRHVSCNCTINESAAARKHAKTTEVLKAATLSLQPFTAQMRRKEYNDLTIAAAKVLGIDEDALLPDELVTYPIVWLCKGNTEEVKPCPEFHFTYTDQGYGYSMNLASWNDMLRTFDHKVFGSNDNENNEQLHADNEFQIYIYNNFDRKR